MFNECLRYEQVTLIDCEWLQIFAWLGNKMKITIEINGKTETLQETGKTERFWKHFRSLASHRCMRLWRHWNLQKMSGERNGENVLSCQTMCEDGMMVVLEAEQKAVIAETGDCYLYPADQTNRLVAACDDRNDDGGLSFAGWKTGVAAWYGQRTECSNAVLGQM